MIRLSRGLVTESATSPPQAVCAVCTPAGPGFRSRFGPTLYRGGRGAGYVHAYVEIPDSDRFLALIANEGVADAGGELIGTFIHDGAIPPPF